MLEPRDYQKAIFEEAKEHNTLVVLPTGMGKTLIALLLAKYHLEKEPEKKILFLAPTRPLAGQHFSTFRKELPELYAELALFTGKINPEKRKEIWQYADIIFSTPQCIANDIKTGKISLDEVSLLIVDEAHRSIKSYDYVKIAEEFRKGKGKILALTASPGSTKEKISAICRNLGIEKVEIRTRHSDDVKPYIQPMKTETIIVELPKEFQDAKKLLKYLYDKKIEELEKRRLIFRRVTKKYLLELQARLRKVLSSGNRNFNVMRGISACAAAIKLQHALELLETQSLNSLLVYLNSLMEQAEQGQSKAVKEITAKEEFKRFYAKISEMVNKGIEHPKMEELEKIVKEELKNKDAKIIIFNNYRDSVARINKMMKRAGINSRIFVGQLIKGETGMSQKEQQQIVREFAEGGFSVLVATAIGEEGLDIPAVDAVIFYEPIPSEIRKIQRMGRTARLVPGKVMILITKGTRDEAYYWAAYHKEKKMHSLLDGIKKKLDGKEQKNLDEY